MREIKFRAWDGDTMFHWDLFDESPFFTYPKNPVMQYTGLKDKNGVEIYEGDVVRILYTDWASKSPKDPRSIEQYMNDCALIGAVVFDTDHYAVEFSNHHQAQSILPGKHGFREVIGNIYETPELLESE